MTPLGLCIWGSEEDHAVLNGHAARLEERDLNANKLFVRVRASWRLSVIGKEVVNRQAFSNGCASSSSVHDVEYIQ